MGTCSSQKHRNQDQLQTQIIFGELNHNQQQPPMNVRDVDLTPYVKEQERANIQNNQQKQQIEIENQQGSDVCEEAKIVPENQIQNEGNTQRNYSLAMKSNGIAMKSNVMLQQMSQRNQETKNQTIDTQQNKTQNSTYSNNNNNNINNNIINYNVDKKQISQTEQQLQTVSYQCRGCNQDIYESIIVVPCTHSFHLSCLLNKLRIDINERNVLFVKCKCGEKIPYKFLKQLDVHDNLQLLSRLMKNQLRFLMNHNQQQLKKGKAYDINMQAIEEYDGYLDHFYIQSGLILDTTKLTPGE